MLSGTHRSFESATRLCIAVFPNSFVLTSKLGSRKERNIDNESGGGMGMVVGGLG